MLERIVICTFAFIILALCYGGIRLYQENERNKEKLAIERRSKSMYKLHSDWLYEQWLAERQRTQRARYDAEVYMALAQVFRGQKKSAPMAVGTAQQENNTTCSVTESEMIVNG